MESYSGRHLENVRRDRCQTVLKHQWRYLNTLDSARTVEKLVGFYVQEHNTRLPLAAFRGQTPDETYWGTVMSVPTELEAVRQQARQARTEANQLRTCSVCEPATVSLSSDRTP